MQEAFLSKSKQTDLSGVDFCAKYENFVSRSQKCLIRPLIEVKGQRVQNPNFVQKWVILHSLYKYVKGFSVVYPINSKRASKIAK